jgi:hypothetical protein
MLKQLLKQAQTIAPAKGWPTYDGLELDRTEFLTSSQVGTCLRKAYFEKNNTPGGGFESNGFAERGHAVEAWLVNYLKPLTELGYRFEYMGDDQRSFYDPDVGISGTPDGLMWLPDNEPVLLEIKSIDPRYNKSKLPKRGHVYQATQNIHLVNRCLRIPVNRAFLSYVDASNFFDITDFEVVNDPYLMQEILERATLLWNAKSADEVEPEGIITGDCDYCPYTGQCSAFIRSEKSMEVAKRSGSNFSPPAAVDVSGADELSLIAYASEWLDYKSMEKDLDVQKDEVQLIVKRFGGRLFIAGLDIAYDEYPGKQTIDKEALIADGVDVSKYLKTGKPYGTLRIKERKA